MQGLGWLVYRLNTTNVRCLQVGYSSTTMKDAQTILRHKHIKTTAEVYMDHIPDSVSRAIEARTEAIFALRSKRQPRKSTGVLLNIAGQSKGKVSVN